ncbi:substrate-binding domain-containing protein [Lysobacter sp. Root494]|uniref:substrate-binding domain-containing protein n=1 Tax=Lysobacter sp. Root494 TaxID=1736549 RepID=UPI0006F495DF|nr:substrate-binding domain-containing protein [Lysobacter sp. Root494]KQY54812.1 amino acid ABC transporter substrate-binding protein [Lysobacter sp. Root494]
MRAAIVLPLLLLAANAGARELRVCADPNNLPYSNARGEGFENRIIALLAKDLDANVRYTWWAQRRGFLRNTLLANDCDVVAGVASSMGMLGTTDPYYRSTYIFVSRADRHLGVHSLDDPRLKQWMIGVQLVGDDGANTPPAHALARRGIAGNVRGYTVYGDYAQAAPQSQVIDAVARGDVDVAIVWGPTAGYFAAKQPVQLALMPVTPWLDGPLWPMVFDTSMGVRKEDRALRRELNAALQRHATEIAAILDAYHVPRVETNGDRVSPAP